MSLEATMTFDAERSLISCLRDEDDESYKAFSYALEQGVSMDHFGDEGCKAWWNATVQAEREGKFGMVEVMQRLPRDFFGQYTYFSEHVLGAHELPTFSKAKAAIDELVKSRNFQLLQSIGENLTLRVKDADRNMDPMDLAVSSEKELQELIKPKSSTLKGSDDLTSDTIKEIRKTLTRGPARIEPHLPWLKLGLNGGFKDNHLVVVAARPSVGKTTIVLNFVYNAALQGKKTLFFSLEMKAESLWEKLGLIRSKEDKDGLPYKTSNQSLNKHNAEKLIMHIEECRKLPIFIDDYAGSSMSNIRTTSRILHRKEGLDCIVIDYLGLVKPEDSKVSREQQVAEISRMAKQLAKELNIPVFLICQLNRDSVKKGSEPQLHDLRESGQIEQDADVVLLLHRDLLGEKEKVSIIVAKNRFGGTGHSRDKIQFMAKSQRFIQVENNRLNDGQREHTNPLYTEDENRL
jgi:replicative DNA helicase